MASGASGLGDCRFDLMIDGTDVLIGLDVANPRAEAPVFTLYQADGTTVAFTTALTGTRQITIPGGRQVTRELITRADLSTVLMMTAPRWSCVGAPA